MKGQRQRARDERGGLDAPPESGRGGDGEADGGKTPAAPEPGSREKILRAAGTLMERQGYHGTGMAEIVKESGAPKGSVYFHFPGGKEQIAAEAVRRAGLSSAERIRSGLSGRRGLAEALAAFVEGIAYHVEASGYQAGGPLLIVAAESARDSGELGEACREAYALMQAVLVERLRADGIKAGEAESLALCILGAIEGGIVLARVQGSRLPLLAVAKQLRLLVRATHPEAKP